MHEETEKTSPPPFELQCDKCKSIHTFDDFSISIIQKGLILLDNPNFCRFGCTCLFCHEATIIKKFSKASSPQEAIDLYNCIYSGQKWFYDILNTSPEMFSGRINICGEELWEYNSFPYDFIHTTTPSFFYERQISTDYLTNFEEPQSICEDPGDENHPCEKDNTSDLFISYLKGSRVAQPAVSILWFTEDKIDDLITLESEQKKKVFPRYTIVDSTWKRMQFFCWNHKLQLDSFKQIEKSVGIPLIEHLSMPSKNKITTAYEFMSILDQPHPHQTSTASINIVPQSIEPVSSLNKSSVYRTKETREKITKKVWDNFNRDFIQEMLITRADKFILEFIELSRSTLLSRNSVWDLKEKYLLELYNAVTSKYQRIVEQKNDTIHWQKRAEEAEKTFPDVKILSKSTALNKLKVQISKLPKVIEAQDFYGPVLLLGEKGTGKTLFAKAIDQATQRKGEFVNIDCSAKSENLFESEIFGHVKGAFTNATENRKGAFEQADDGTLFLDEIGNLSIALQNKLLGVLQERKYQPVGSSITKKTNAFIIAATNKNLELMVENGEFKGDLFDRLNEEPIIIPPLRERKDDIPLFFNHLKTNFPIDPDLENDLKKLKYEWSGNVRELKSIIGQIERRKIMEDDTTPICFDDLPEKIRGTKGKSEKKEKKKLPGNQKFTDEELVEAMAKFNNVKKLVAIELSSTPKTIWKRWKELQEKKEVLHSL